MSGFRRTFKAEAQNIPGYVPLLSRSFSTFLPSFLLFPYFYHKKILMKCFDHTMPGPVLNTLHVSLLSNAACDVKTTPTLLFLPQRQGECGPEVLDDVVVDG